MNQPVTVTFVPEQVITWIVIGLIAGFLASIFVRGRGLGLLGNVIVGYNEDAGANDARSGSHTVVIGGEHSFSSTGGFLAGFNNLVLWNHHYFNERSGIRWIGSVGRHGYFKHHLIICYRACLLTYQETFKNRVECIYQRRVGSE